MTTETITCPCGTTFQWQNENPDSVFWSDTLRPERCETCQDQYDREAEAQREIERQEAADRQRQDIADRIDRVTPPRYRATDPDHPDFNRQLWQHVMAWQPTDRTPFLGLVGPSGASKTRCAYLKLKSLVMASVDHGKAATWAAVTAGEFGETVLGQFRKTSAVRDLHDRDPQAAASSYLKSLRRSDIVLFDDLGKGRATPAVTEELFHLIDHRHAHNLPTLWTANSSPEAIVTGMSEDIAGPLAGRLIECSYMPKV